MKVAELLDRRRQQWRDLEALCRMLEGRRLRKLGGAGVSRFASLYRAACADLALADAYQLPPDTVQYLHQLVGRAHNQLYRSQRFRWRQWGDEMFVALPQRLLTRPGAVAGVGDFLGYVRAVDAAGVFLARVLPGRGRRGRRWRNCKRCIRRRCRAATRAAAPWLTGFYVWNNAGIGLQCFVGGLILGIGGLYITITNALFLGAAFGFMLSAPEWRKLLGVRHGARPLRIDGHRLLGRGRHASGLFADCHRRAVTRRVAATGGQGGHADAGCAVVLFCLAAFIEGSCFPRPRRTRSRRAPPSRARRCWCSTSWAWARWRRD